jgi:hypothetical protein
VGILAGTSSVYYNGGRVLEKFGHYRPGQECPSMLEPSLEMERAAAQSMAFAATRDCYLFNIEDLDIRNVASVPFETAARGTSEAIQSIIILHSSRSLQLDRDPDQEFIRRVAADSAGVEVPSDPLKCARTQARDWTNQANAAICSATPRPKAVW